MGKHGPSAVKHGAMYTMYMPCFEFSRAWIVRELGPARSTPKKKFESPDVMLLLGEVFVFPIRVHLYSSLLYCNSNKVTIKN